MLASNLVNHPDFATCRRLLAGEAVYLDRSGQLLVEWEPAAWFERWARV